MYQFQTDTLPNFHCIEAHGWAFYTEAKELNPRADHNYALSWIRREAASLTKRTDTTSVYAMRPMLEHVVAGIQYAHGVLNADDSPSVKPK